MHCVIAVEFTCKLHHDSNIETLAMTHRSTCLLTSCNLHRDGLAAFLEVSTLLLLLLPCVTHHQVNKVSIWRIIIRALSVCLKAISSEKKSNRQD